MSPPRTRVARGVHAPRRALASAAAAVAILASVAGWGASQAQPATPAPAVASASVPPGLAGSYVVDLTWISDETGWALSGAPCGKQLCPRIARTEDGGRSWTELPSPPTHLTGPACTRLPCVDHLRFATPAIGYLFGPSLLVTRDGGLTWGRMAGPQVESLEPGAGVVVRVTYDHSGCPGPCDRRVEVAADGSSRWRVLLARLPAAAEAPVGAQLIRAAPHAIYVAIYGNLANGAEATQHTTIFRSLDDGRSWVALADPCGGSVGHERDAIGVAAAPGGFVAALCATRTFASFSVTTSSDGGQAWGPRRQVPAAAHFAPDLIAATGANDLLITNSLTSGSGPCTYRLMRSADDGRTWSTVASDRAQLDPDAPYASFLGFEDSLVGRWVGTPHAVWTTTDGGRHWTRRSFP